jgi:hypothetical protein
MLPAAEAEANQRLNEMNITLHWFEELNQRVPVH